MGGDDSRRDRSFGGPSNRKIQAARRKQKNMWLASLRKRHSR